MSNEVFSKADVLKAAKIAFLVGFAFAILAILVFVAGLLTFGGRL